ncbi:hypothetical protein GF325_05205 [Candidatus Bathyarchaeota archaeon]|nr:hypothetical protein [Candidatus Bathyarchaeota archaeon]
MIDQDALNDAWENDSFYSLQLELGDACSQGCLYCYMNALPAQENTLDDEMVKGILVDAAAMGISAIEWLGGEPLLRSSVLEHLAFARELGFRNNLWTGGLPLVDQDLRASCASLCMHGLISVHVSTVDPTLYERLHPGRTRKDLSSILGSVHALLEDGYPSSQMLNSVTFTGLQPASDMISTIDYFEEHFGIATSLNVYHTYLRPGQSRENLARFIPEPAAVARVYNRMKAQAGVDMLPMNCVNKQYCSSTLAVLCDGTVTPCATIREPDAPNLHQEGNLKEIVKSHWDHLIFKKFKDKGNLPNTCKTCMLSSTCWGCRSRAYAAGLGLFGPDPRCFLKKHR